MGSKNLRHVLTAEQIAYLDDCARRRGISVSALVKRLFKAICADQMVLSILDDDGKPGLQANERSYERMRRREG